MKGTTKVTKSNSGVKEPTEGSLRYHEGIKGQPKPPKIKISR